MMKYPVWYRHNIQLQGISYVWKYHALLKCLFRQLVDEVARSIYKILLNFIFNFIKIVLTQSF